MLAESMYDMPDDPTLSRAQIDSTETPARGMSSSDEWSAVVEDTLRVIAARYMRRERPNHTLQTTALVNEAYVRLAASKAGVWNDRNHFLALASRVMRQILIDHARRRKAQRRDPEHHFPEIEPPDLSISSLTPDVLDIHAALKELALIAPRQAQLVELRFFGGASMDEASAVLGMSPRTADKDWVLARSWLRARLAAGPAGE